MGWVVGMVFVASGCDSPRSTCEEAQGRLAECGQQLQSSGTSTYSRLPLQVSNDCKDPADACLASCVSNSNCAAITRVVQGPSNDPNASPVIPPGTSEFAECLQRCFEIATQERTDAGP